MAKEAKVTRRIYIGKVWCKKMHLKAEVAFIVLASFNDVAQDRVFKSRSGCIAWQARKVSI